GRPVLTLQKAQARVHTSPMIIMVACRASQHSPMLGQPASTHTVWRPWSRTIRRVSAYALEPGALTRIQSGLRSAAVSCRCAFSGWRGPDAVVSRATTMSVTPFVKEIHCARALPSALIRLPGPSDLTVVANGARMERQERVAFQVDRN